MNIAKLQIAHYESDDFTNNYIPQLVENFNNNQKEILEKIQNIIQYDYCWEKNYGFCKFIPIELCKEIYNFINENFDEFVTRYKNYYVGSTSLESTSFGEESVYLPELINHKLNQKYNYKYLLKVFNDSSFTINSDGCAYYDMTSSGLYLDLLKHRFSDELINKLKYYGNQE